MGDLNNARLGLLELFGSVNDTEAFVLSILAVKNIGLFSFFIRLLLNLKKCLFLFLKLAYGRLASPSSTVRNFLKIIISPVN